MQIGTLITGSSPQQMQPSISQVTFKEYSFLIMLPLAEGCIWFYNSFKSCNLVVLSSSACPALKPANFSVWIVRWIIFFLLLLKSNKIEEVLALIVKV